jgi:hypothetical protein
METTMHNVTDKTVQEKLQVLNDYIQRTIDVLNELSTNTRQVAMTLGVGNVQGRAPFVGVPGGLGHSTFGQVPFYGQQVLGQQLPLTQIPQVPQVPGYGLVPQIVPQQYGLMHTPFGVMPINAQQVWPQVNPFWSQQIGVPQMQQIPVGGLNQATNIPVQGPLGTF